MKFLTSFYSLLMLFALLLPCTSIAQNKSFAGVLKVSLKNMGPIIEKNEVKGYYTFYETDKLNRKTSAYLLQILDENLNVVSSKNITDSDDLRLLEGVYDGQSILLKFYNTKSKEAILRVYDKSAELKQNKTRKVESKWEIAQYNSAITEETKGVTVFGIANTGFVSYAMEDNKSIGYSMEFLPEDATQKSWTYKSNANSKDVETANFLAEGNGILLTHVGKRPSLLSQDATSYLLATDVKTGNKLFEKKLQSTKHDLVLLNGFTDETTGNIAVLGLYYEKDVKTMKAKSLGLFAQVLDKQGNLVSENYTSWAKDVSKFLPVNAKGKMDDTGYIFFHNIIKSKDEKIYAIGENFKRTVSATAALAVLGGSLTQMVIEDMFIFEFTPDFKLNNVKVFDKGKSNFQLPRGSEYYSVQLLAAYIKSVGGFDYTFTQPDNSKNVFSVGYVDYEKKKGEKNEWVFGAITCADSEFSADKISLQTEASELQVFVAKPGYVMISEYFSKAKKMDLRLEKINY